MSLVGKEIPEFTLDAYKPEEFIKVSQDDLKGHWSVLAF